jgi:hypothetical protein
MDIDDADGYDRYDFKRSGKAMEDQAVGAIWERVSKNGKRYLSIKVGESEYVAFQNDKGDNPKRPDFKIFASKPRDEQPPNDRTVPF